MVAAATSGVSPQMSAAKKSVSGAATHACASLGVAVLVPPPLWAVSDMQGMVQCTYQPTMDVAAEAAGVQMWLPQKPPAARTSFPSEKPEAGHGPPRIPPQL